ERGRERGHRRGHGGIFRAVSFCPSLDLGLHLCLDPATGLAGAGILVSGPTPEWCCHRHYGLPSNQRWRGSLGPRRRICHRIDPGQALPCSTDILFVRAELKAIIGIESAAMSMGEQMTPVKPESATKRSARGFRLAPWLFGSAIFLSAFLLFLVQ